MRQRTKRVESWDQFAHLQALDPVRWRQSRWPPGRRTPGACKQADARGTLLIRKACLAGGVSKKGLVLHSDNGSPMKGATMLATLQ